MKNRLTGFLFGLTQNFTLSLVGQLIVSELLCLLYLPFIDLKKLFKQFVSLRSVTKLLLWFLFMQIISDIANSSSSDDFIRGWAMIIFSGISCVVFTYVMSRDDKSILFFFIAVFIIKLFLGGNELNLNELDEDSNLFKVRFLPFLNPLLYIIIYYLFSKKHHLLTIGVMLSFAIICFYFDGRSNGLIFLIAAILTYTKVKKISISVLTIILMISISYLLYVLYIIKIVDGSIGGINSVSQVGKMNNPYNPFELLYLGRTDFFVLVEAIKDKPLFGHGSWGKDPNNKYSNLLSFFTNTDYNEDLGYIRAHSVLLGVWAYSGFFGFLMIFSLFLKFLKMYRKIFSSVLYSPYFPILSLVFIDMIWSFLFSPIGYLRFGLPILAAIVIIEYQKTLINNSLNES